MIRIVHALRLIAAVATLAALGGCSDEPGVSDMKQAIQQNPQVQALSKMAGKEPKTTDFELEKGGCVPATNATGHFCDVRVKPAGATQFSPWLKARFFKAGGGWNVDQLR